MYLLISMVINKIVWGKCLFVNNVKICHILFMIYIFKYQRVTNKNFIKITLIYIPNPI